jgi:hypothetical protein
MRNQVSAHGGGKPGGDNLDELDHETRENGGIARHLPLQTECRVKRAISGELSSKK